MCREEQAVEEAEMLPEAFEQRQHVKQRAEARSQELFREMEQLPPEEREVQQQPALALEPFRPVASLSSSMCTQQANTMTPTALACLPHTLPEPRHLLEFTSGLIVPAHGVHSSCGMCYEEGPVQRVQPRQHSGDGTLPRLVAQSG